MPKLSANSVKRIGKQIRQSERSSRFPAIGDRRINKAVNLRPGMLAVLSTAISARVGTTLGSGTATLQSLENGVYSAVAGGGVQTIYNMLTVVIPLSVSVVKVSLVDGHLIADLADCPTGTS